MVWNDKLKRAIPEGWIVARLSDFIEEHISGDWGNDDIADSCMPVSCIRGADMKTMDDLPLRYIPVSHTDRLLHDGDIVIEMSGGSPTQSTGRSVCITSRIIEENKGSLICSNFCHALVIKTPYKYFFHYLWQKLYENGNMFNFEGKTSGLRNLQLDSLCSSYWAFPRTKAYLEAFNVKVDAFLEERDNNKLTVKALEKQRSTVLPLLMNGQVSVKQLNNHFAERNRMLSSAFSKSRMYERRINPKNRGGDGWFPLRRTNATFAGCGSVGVGRIYYWTGVDRHRAETGG